jgi:hypothetical protein
VGVICFSIDDSASFYNPFNRINWKRLGEKL